VKRTLAAHAHVATLADASSHELTGTVATSAEVFAEEERSKQPSLFSVVRAIQTLFYHESEAQVDPSFLGILAVATCTLLFIFGSSSFI
jgi:hypothetical protein